VGKADLDNHASRVSMPSKHTDVPAFLDAVARYKTARNVFQDDRKA